MTEQTLTEILALVRKKNPIHAKKLEKNLERMDGDYRGKFEPFIKKYVVFLKAKGKNLEYGVDCYLKMVADMTYEQIRFSQTGEYTSKCFDEVASRVYLNPEIMEYYMVGLLLSQYLWVQHFEMFKFFSSQLASYKDKITNYLEIGGGHGLFLSQAVEVLHAHVRFDLVDISPTAINLSKRFIGRAEINYILSDIRDYKSRTNYDFIAMGEVLEHVEKPLELLDSVTGLLAKGGTLFLTTPANAPTIDHIYLFRNVQEIRGLLREAGLRVTKDHSACAEIAAKDADLAKAPLMYGAFLEKCR